MWSHVAALLIFAVLTNAAPRAYRQRTSGYDPETSGDVVGFQDGESMMIGPPMPIGGPYDIASMMHDPGTSADVVYGPSMPNYAKGLAYDALQKVKTPNMFVQNSATGSVINTGGAVDGVLEASGGSKTRTGPLGALSHGNAFLSGTGLGVSATSVNTAGAGSIGKFRPSDASSSATFVNSMNVDKGKVSGQSETNSRTGLNGGSMSSASGRSFGSGLGVQLTQVANADSQGSSALPFRGGFDFGPMNDYLMDPEYYRYKRSSDYLMDSLYDIPNTDKLGGSPLFDSFTPFFPSINGTKSAAVVIFARFGPGIKGKTAFLTGSASSAKSEHQALMDQNLD